MIKDILAGVGVATLIYIFVSLIIFFRYWKSSR